MMTEKNKALPYHEQPEHPRTKSSVMTDMRKTNLVQRSTIDNQNNDLLQQIQSLQLQLENKSKEIRMLRNEKNELTTKLMDVSQKVQFIETKEFTSSENTVNVIKNLEKQIEEVQFANTDLRQKYQQKQKNKFNLKELTQVIIKK
ncbi:hypothetical protein IMG5_174590 [Ichthyophthirius multifiliis]|uniref:Uncharacterized protein n=1 Tax=Ichthyophthirius multifiliis TaxID=5932 RepID=G0R232_ICHMU|nr:hypothetical protein IMG5_174590 [Ichthyophthirius multifiliis]EGR28474.1 hypothetical protein IMG5_174590 [Ichthyophthirius multifiliis]|eukprot:XP_004029710.1 hypothetical protein IMG5_174590 [Ichthyophthirius multifiliis]